MSGIGFVLEKIRHGSELSTGETKMLADEIDRMVSKLEACARELGRREDADAAARQQDKARVEKLRLAEEEVARLQDALAHARRQKQVEYEKYLDNVRNLEGTLKDVGYALRYQPELSREEMADVIEREVGAHTKPGSP